MNFVMAYRVYWPVPMQYAANCAQKVSNFDVISMNVYFLVNIIVVFTYEVVWGF